MIDQLEDLCTQFPFQCILTLTGVMCQDKFGYTEVNIVAISVDLKLAV